MKLFEKILFKYPLWLSFIISFIIFLFLGFVVFSFFPPMTSKNILVISSVMSAMFSLLIVLLVFLNRKSDEFWEEAKIVQTLIDEAKTKDEIRSIYNNQFKDLRKKQMGQPHHIILTRMIAIMETKIQFLPEKQKP